MVFIIYEEKKIQLYIDCNLLLNLWHTCNNIILLHIIRSFIWEKKKKKGNFFNNLWTIFHVTNGSFKKNSDLVTNSALNITGNGSEV